MAGILKLHRRHVAGTYMEFAEWVDEETTDGTITGVSPDYIDELVTTPGFAKALEAVGWIHLTPAGIQVSNFDRHNGASAKARAGEMIRKRQQRASGQIPHRRPDTSTEPSGRKCDQRLETEPRAKSQSSEISSGLANAGESPAVQGLAAWLQGHGIREPKRSEIVAKANGSLTVGDLEAEWRDLTSDAAVAVPAKVLFARLCQRFGIELTRAKRLTPEQSKMRSDFAQLRANRGVT